VLDPIAERKNKFICIFSRVEKSELEFGRLLHEITVTLVIILVGLNKVRPDCCWVQVNHVDAVRDIRSWTLFFRPNPNGEIRTVHSTPASHRGVWWVNMRNGATVVDYYWNDSDARRLDRIRYNVDSRSQQSRLKNGRQH